MKILNVILFMKSIKDNLIKYKCLSFNKNYLSKIDEELKMRFQNTFKFSNNDINKSILLWQKSVNYTWKIDFLSLSNR